CFEDTTFIFDNITHRLREIAFLNAGVKINLKDEREENKEVSYKYNGGLSLVITICLLESYKVLKV
ncbi:unnamed protein product, partial [marine sediment metagenome]